MTFDTHRASAPGQANNKRKYTKRTDPIPPSDAGLFPPIRAKRIPTEIISLLRAAAAAENAARGTARQRAFRTTSHLITGALACGYSPYGIAAILAAAPSAIITRGDQDGLVEAATFVHLADIPCTTLETWIAVGRLHPATTPAGQQFVASELIAALTAHPPTDQS